jgi:hypothetical protein
VSSYFCGYLFFVVSYAFELLELRTQARRAKTADDLIEFSVLYYPTLVWAITDVSLHRKTILGPEHEEAQGEGDAGERQPLLG